LGWGCAARRRGEEPGGARRPKEAEISFQILEPSDGVGRRVRTGEHEGFPLDCGFQVFFTAYPEAQRRLESKALDLRPFRHGALVWFAGGFHRIVGPWRRLEQWYVALEPPERPVR